MGKIRHMIGIMWVTLSVYLSNKKSLYTESHLLQPLPLQTSMKLFCKFIHTFCCLWLSIIVVNTRNEAYNAVERVEESDSVYEEVSFEPSPSSTI